MKRIFFVHGFGVRKDARGMFPEIENFLQEKNSDLCCFYTDLNNFSNNGKDTFLLPLGAQLKNLESTLKENFDCKDQNVLIAHSQWCVVSSLLKWYHFNKVIFLAPPSNNDFDKLLDNMKKRPGAQINLDWESIFPRSDGSKTYIPKEYWDERKKLNYLSLYNEFSNQQKVTIIQAIQDELIDNTHLQKENIYADIFSIDGNHNFDWADRPTLLSTIDKTLEFIEK